MASSITAIKTRLKENPDAVSGQLPWAVYPLPASAGVGQRSPSLVNTLPFLNSGFDETSYHVGTAGDISTDTIEQYTEWMEHV